MTAHSAVFAELHQLCDNDFVRRNAAVPTIAVPVPFDAAVLQDRIRAHVDTWASKQLFDPAFAAQLDRYMVPAADAYRHNQNPGLPRNTSKLCARCLTATTKFWMEVRRRNGH